MDKINTKNIQFDAKAIVCNQYNIQDVNVENDFMLLGDEFDFIELIMRIEDHFEIVISDSDAACIKNFQALLSHLSINCK